ncbi:MAG TPA: glycosyltransferase [Candidatus Paceibacterota bacterium]|jgi:glycosyltransferase involved in cell wall biosynthesis|nr:glycosyltransferase [Candidatus Paceibacterota bacterium]
MAKVFIGMPVYNGEHFLKEALDSLCSQTYSNWNMHISDDGSTDSTEAICRLYVEKDKRITYYRQPKNIGMFENFKYTLEKSNSEYFMWAAQDDLWEKTFLETCVSILDNDTRVGLAGTTIAEIDSYGRTARELLSLEKLSGKPSVKTITHYVLEPEILGRCNIMYGLWRTAAIKETWKAYPQRSVWGQDYMFVLAGISRFGVKIDNKTLFKKRLGGYSSPDATKNDAPGETQKRTITNPKDYIFPLGRFNVYFKGHMEALRGTPYQPLAAVLLLARLPRALWNHFKQTP